MDLLKKILKQDIDVKQICYQIKTHMDAPSKLQLIHILFGLSKADNEVHIDEINMIEQIATLIGVGTSDFESIKAMFVPNTESAYKILGVANTVTDKDVKLAYRKMASKYHPDKVAHLGDDFSKVAEEKFKSINDAYQKIKKERGM